MFLVNYLNSFHEGLKATECHVSEIPTGIDKFFEELNSKISDKTRIFFYGNGASMAFASHMSLDWHKNGKIESHTLSDISLLTAFMNDYSREEMLQSQTYYDYEKENNEPETDEDEAMETHNTEI